MEIHILGCGNILRQDDGWGPVVTDYINDNYEIPENVLVLDGGLACGEWLKPFILDPDRPGKIIILDVLDMGEEPGTIKVIKAENMELLDLSMNSHMFPDKQTVELLLRQDVELIFVSCQHSPISNEIMEGLSDKVAAAVPVGAAKAAELADLTPK